MSLIFCVEDDASIRELVLYTLGVSGFTACGFDCATALFTALKKDKPQLVLLDIMLPEMSGMEILQKIRSTPDTKDIPVIMLTAKSDRLDKIKGLDCGADDYITKPFDILELISRIKAVLRRTATNAPLHESITTLGEISIDRSARKVTAASLDVLLTYKEYELLLYLITNKGKVLSRTQLMNEIWGTEFEGESRTVDVHVRTLRQKLGECGKYIETVRNVGYRMCDNV